MLRLQLSSGLKSRRKELDQWIKYIGAAISAFFVSNVRLLGSLSPFGTALAMALPAGPSTAAVAGGMLGYVFLGSFENNLPYLIALLGVLAFKLALAGHSKLRNNTGLLCGFTAAILSVTLTVSNTLSGASTVGILLGLAESLLGGAMTWFCIYGIKALENFTPGERTKSIQNPIQMASLGIMALTALIGICGIQLSVFNLGRILGALFLLCVANRRGALAAAGTGLALGASLTLYSPDFAVSGGILALSAMVSAIFAKFGRIVQTAMFAVMGTVGVLVAGTSPEILTGTFDALVAAACFLLLPSKILDLFAGPVAPSGIQHTPDHSRIAARLRFASQTVADIRESVDAVSKRLNRTGAADISGVYDQAADRVCRRCGLKMFCWETAYNQAAEAFQKLTPVLKSNSRIVKDDLPPFFRSKCPKTEELIREVNGCYHEFISHENAGRKVLGAKQVALEQLDGIAEMLRDAGDEISESELLDTGRAEKIQELLSELGEDADEIYCIVDRYDRIRVEIYREKPFRLDKKLITEQLSQLLERPLDQPCIVSAGDLTKICFFEQARFALQFGACQKNAGDNRISGDCYEYFADPRGFAHIILSDGMGSGGRAAVDSIMTCNFVLKLIKAGFGFDAALKFINSALLVKAGDESLATLDIGCIDLYTGTAEFLKAGGAASFLCRDGHTVAIGGTSLPAGILQGIGYDRHSTTLREGDVIIMVTDGALPISAEWFQDEVVTLKDLPPDEMAEKLATLAQRRQQRPGDDITVVAARVVSAG